MRGHRPNALVCDGFQREWFLFVSADAAVIPDLAWRIYEEGHDVKYDVEAESDREVGDGFVPRTDDWRDDEDDSRARDS